MSKVTGTVLTKYGKMQFYMSSAKQVVLVIDGEWTVHGVGYKGTTEVAKLEEGQDTESMSAVNGWYERSQATYIRRVDGKDINYRSDAYNNIRREMLRAFTQYINNPDNIGLLTIAAKVNLDNERSKLMADIARCQKEFDSALTALEQWDEKHGDKYYVLRLGADRAMTKAKDVRIEE